MGGKVTHRIKENSQHTRRVSKLSLFDDLLVRRGLLGEGKLRVVLLELAEDRSTAFPFPA